MTASNLTVKIFDIFQMQEIKNWGVLYSRQISMYDSNEYLANILK